MFCDEEHSDSDDDWIFNSIQKYDDLLMFEFQGKVSSATFLSPETLIATSKNTNGRNEILELAVPDRLLAVKDVGLAKNRDFSVISAGYLKSEATSVISSGNLLITSEEEGISLYSIPKEEDSDLITHKSCIRRLHHPQICYEGPNLISGSKLNNIKSHCIENMKETRDYSSIFEDTNWQGSYFLSYLNSSCNELMIGCRDNGHLLNFDIRSQKFNSVELNESNCKWSYSLSCNRQNVCIINSLGFLYLFDSRYLSKEVSKLKFEYDVCEEGGEYLCTYFDPSDSFVSISGFDKCVNVFLGKASTDNSPIFCHDGHKKHSHFLCGHVWHPTLTNVIFSFDDNGTLQAWKFR